MARSSSCAVWLALALVACSGSTPDGGAGGAGGTESTTSTSTSTGPSTTSTTATLTSTSSSTATSSSSSVDASSGSGTGGGGAAASSSAATGGGGASVTASSSSTGVTSPCDAPGLIVIRCQQPAPRGIFAANGHVYWADYEGGYIYVANPDGSGVALTPKPNDPSTADNPLYVSVAGTDIYWSEPESGDVRMVRDDGAVFLIANGQNPSFVFTRPSGLGIDTWWVETVEFGRVVRDTTGYGMYDYPDAVLADDTYFYIKGGRAQYLPNGMIGAYATYSNAPDRPTPGRFAIDATDMYWVGYTTALGTYGLFKAPLDGSAPAAQIAAIGGTNQSGVVVDGANVYFLDEAGGLVERIATSGDPSTRVVIASGQQRPWDLAVDATEVYWTTQGDPNQARTGSVMAALK